MVHGYYFLRPAREVQVRGGTRSREFAKKNDNYFGLD